MPDEPVLMTQGEVEQRLRLGQRSFSRLRRLGADLPPRTKIGKSFFYRWDDVLTWLDRQKEEPQ